MKTRGVIMGCEFMLEEGVRYLATRPFNEPSRKVYPVSIRRITPTGSQPANVISTEPEVVVDGLDYEQAAALVDAFNNGKSSFDGRVW